MNNKHHGCLNCYSHESPTYTCVLMLIQTHVAEIADKLVTLVSDLQAHWPRDEIQLQFSTNLAHTMRRLNKDKNIM
jgi:hypothetical protein